MKIALFALYAAFVLLLIFLSSPGTFFERYSKTLVLRDGPMATQVWKEAPAPAAASFEYLGNPQRDQRPFPPLEWPLETDWQVDGFNRGVHTASKSSVAADDTGIYVGNDLGSFYAYSPDGKLMWSFQAADNPSGFHGTALLTKDTVFVGAYNGRFYAFDKLSGELNWVKRVADAVGSSPLLLKDSILLSAEFDSVRAGHLLRIDPRNGSELWRTHTFAEQVHSSPTVSADGRLTYVGDNSGYYRAYNTRDGQPVWIAQLGGPVKGTGLFHDGRIYVASWSKSLVALDAETGRLIWRAMLANTSQSSPLLVDDILVIASHRENSMLYGLNPATGLVRWRIPIPDQKINGMSSPAAFHSKKLKRNFFLFPCAAKRLCVVDPRDGRVVYQREVPDNLSSVPTIHKGRVFLTFHDGPLLTLKQSR